VNIEKKVSAIVCLSVGSCPDNEATPAKGTLLAGPAPLVTNRYDDFHAEITAGQMA
jgi:hypothetical protein